MQFSKSSQWQGSSQLGEGDEEEGGGRGHHRDSSTGRWDSVGVQGSGAVAGATVGWGTGSGQVGLCSVHATGSGGMSPLAGAMHQPRAGRLRRERPGPLAGQGCRGGGWESGEVGEGSGGAPRWGPSHHELPEEEEDEKGEYNAARPGLLSGTAGDPRVAMARIPGQVDLTGSQIT